jgi:hypothetical protein
MPAGLRGAGVADAARWIALRAGAALAAILVVVLIAGFLLGSQASGPTATWARSTGHDALWMGHAWVDGGHSQADLGRLAARIRTSGIRDVYVLAGQLSAGGRLSPAQYPGAGPFLASFRAALPGVRVSAWLAGVVGGGHINLADAATRASIVTVASAMLRAGFNGVHYDLEPVSSGNTGLLSLLDATRRLHPASLSVAAPKLEPLPGLRLPASLVLLRPVFWTTGYLTEVASRVSQVVIMSYDTGMPVSSWYAGYVKRETTMALRAVPSQAVLRMGVPAFHGSNLGHHPGAESVAAAVRGIRVGLTSAGHQGMPFGVALFADDSATPQDWAAYLADWVRPG